jgi:hypothetical protein
LKVDPPRPLNHDEHAILGFLLQPELDGVEQLRAQVPGAIVVGKCDCGCPTIDIEVDTNAPSSGLAGPLSPVGARVSPESDEPIGDVILFLKDGRLSSLEYVYYTDQPPDRWPTLDRLSTIEIDLAADPGSEVLTFGE